MYTRTHARTTNTNSGYCAPAAGQSVFKCILHGHFLCYTKACVLDWLDNVKVIIFAVKDPFIF